MALNEEEARLYVELGLIHIKQKRLEAALEDFTRAIAADSEHPLAYQHRGTLHVMQHRYDEAIADFQAVLQHQPDSTLAHFGMGGALLKLEQYAAALEHLERAAAQGHPRAPHYVQRARARLQEQAAAQEREIPVSPPEAPPPEAVSEAEVEEEPAQLPETAAAPETPESLNDQGLQWLAKRQYDQALALFKRAAELDPGFAKAHFNAAGILQGQGELTEALEHLKPAVQLGYEPAKSLAAEVYRKLKEQEAQPDDSPAEQVSASAEELLKNAAHVLTKFARHHCGADRVTIQRTEKGVFGVGERQVTTSQVRWEVSLKERHVLLPGGTRESVQGVELDLQQTPRALIRVTLNDAQTYLVQIMAEEPIPKTKHKALLGKVSEVISATPQQLLALLNNFVAQGVLIKEESHLRYASQS